MKYDMAAPCTTCPFRRGTAVQLHPDRVIEITDMMLDFQGGTFQCHNTIDFDKLPDSASEHCRMDKARSQPGAHHCAGALIFALKHETLPQMARIATRVGMLNPDKLMENEAVTDLVYDSVDEMVADHRAERKAMA